MANYGGRNGAATYNGQSIGELISWEFSYEGELIEDTVKGDSLRTYVPDLPTGRCTLVAFLDRASTGQDAMMDDVEAGLNNTARAVVLTVASGKTFSFSAYVTGYVTGSPEGGERDRVTFTLALTTAVTPAWA